MTERNESARDRDDIRRVAAEITARLAALGITLSGKETPEQLIDVAEAVERFENAVQAHGGDLMMDEPPAGHAGQPDDRHFALPLRGDDERVEQYLERLAKATDEIRKHGRTPRAD
jgi:hypothetical protein